MVLQLAAIYKLFGYHPLVARLFYVLLGTAIVLLIYLLGTRLFGKQAGLLAAIFAALYSYLILYSAALLTETPFILLLLVAIVSAYIVVEDGDHRYLFLVGIGLAGAVLFRMAVLAFIPLFLAWIYFASRASSRKPVTIWMLFIPCIMIIVAVLPWTLRNYRLFDRFMLLQSQFGHVFWNSNHPGQGTDFSGPLVAPIPEELTELNEADLTYELFRRGRLFVVQDPIRFILLTVSRTKQFFTFWPTSESGLASNIARILSFGILLPFMGAGLILSMRNWKRYLPIYLFLLIHITIHVTSWVMVRYRIPADVLLLPFAAMAVTQLISYLNVQRNGRAIRQVSN
jgi:4-amino-4-deoxy-L-arabinose transferase-like glycosyltransferase